MQANLAGEEYKEPQRLNPITNPGSMAGLEADLNENTIQILLSDEWCRTIDSLQTGGGGDSKAVTSALAPLVDLEACRGYHKRFKVAQGVDIPKVAFYSLLYGQDHPIVNFLVGKAEETGLSARFRTTFIEGGDKDYGTNWSRVTDGLEGEIDKDTILDMKMKSTRTDKAVKANITCKLTSIIRNVYCTIACKSRFTLKESSVKDFPALNVMHFIDTDT